MDKLYEKFNKYRFVSTLFLLLLSFTFFMGFRYYIYENISKSLTLGQLGEFGSKITITLANSLLLSIGALFGGVLGYLMRKKISSSFVNTMMFISSLLCFMTLFINPYNIQLITAQNLQNIVTISTIGMFVFGFINATLLVYTITINIVSLKSEVNAVNLVGYSICGIIAVVLAFISLYFKMSIMNLLAIYSICLIVLSITKKLTNSDVVIYNEQSTFKLGKTICVTIIFVLLIACFIYGILATESMVALK